VDWQQVSRTEQWMRVGVGVLGGDVQRVEGVAGGAEVNEMTENQPIQESPPSPEKRKPRQPTNDGPRHSNISGPTLPYRLKSKFEELGVGDKELGLKYLNPTGIIAYMKYVRLVSFCFLS